MASSSESDGRLYQRWWKVWPFPRCCLPCNAVLHPCRAAVSQKKTRFQQDGFDLDLTYVTSRIIVHGFPATGVEHIYRNPRTEVLRLLDKYHMGHYKVFNFANEPGRTYPAQLFEGRVERYPFTDHTCPPLESVVEFCESAKAWLDINEENVVSLHCKAGKGRAGLMAACLMVRLGQTAEAAVMKFDTTRVSDLKGLTVVNQRKWAFMYERLIKEVWGLQESIGMVPGRDPDLRAPALRATCIREISVQLQPTTAAGKRSDNILPNLSCAIYQQEPMGKILVHRAKMVSSAPLEEEPGMIFAAFMPRSAVIQGTFQVLISAAVGAASTQKSAIDLWWNTTFLSPDGGDQAFELSEMDVSPLKLAARLHQATAHVVLRHTHPHAASPSRRAALKGQSKGENDGEHAQDSEGTVAQESDVDATDEGGAKRPAASASDRSLAQNRAPQNDGGAEGSKTHNEKKPGRGSGDASSAARGNSKGDQKGLEADAVAGENEDISMGAQARRQAAGFDKQDAVAGPSPALPGPSPAGLASPVWTFEGRIPSSGRAPTSGRAIGETWARNRMWTSNPGVSSGGVSTPGGMPSATATDPAAARGSGLKAKRRTGQGSESVVSEGAKSSPSMGSTCVPTGTWSSMREAGIGTKEKTAGSGEKAYAFPQHETDSDSDDQVAVRASAFGGGAAAGAGEGGQPLDQHFAGRGPTPRTALVENEQWAMEMEMAFTQERRRWEEHQHCLETELDWALAARARAEARSEEDSARVEVLESRLSAWRSEYTVIERDVKQAVRLLEMSLSGLMSAESALKRWKGEIPTKAYEDIMGCLTKGDMSHARSS